MVDARGAARYDNGGPDIATTIAVDNAGNVYVTGMSDDALSGPSTTYDFATIKYDSNGNQLWIQRYDMHTYNFIR